MYLTTLTVHSLLRWLVIALALWAILRAYAGASGRPWSPADEAAGRWFTISLDVQFVVGLILYGLLSPITAQAFADMGGAMRSPVLRFWAVEHLVLVIAALAFAHIGRSRARKARTDAARHRQAAIFYTLALLAVLAAVPWPFMEHGRPLFRLGN
jgi:hypothetical protein